MTAAIPDALVLSAGSHQSRQDGMCVMEAVSYVAGERWSDAPQCTCPIIAGFLRSWNDGLPTDADRDRLLRPLIPAVIGTRSTLAVELRRAAMAADWLIRIYTPAWLRLAELEEQARALESLPEIADFAQCSSITPTLKAVRADAASIWADVRTAAGDAAWAVAWAVAGDAAWDAAGDALEPTTKALQDSAVQLVRRMAAVEQEQNDG